MATSGMPLDFNQSLFLTLNAGSDASPAAIALASAVATYAIAIVPFAVIIWALRQTAPTDLVRTGALGGLVAGAVSATAYAFHCVDDSLPFVALWYGGTIALCTLAGATLGPRLLRW